jgi:hypothetical protein
MDKIILLGTDCTLGHGFQDFIGYNFYYYDKVRKSPFGGTWIFNPENRKGFKRVNYGSLGVVAEVIENNFDGWTDTELNYRGKLACKKYPIEFTHGHFNTDAIDLFLERLKKNDLITFCSSWRVYYGFNPAHLKQDKKALESGIEKFKQVVKTPHELKLFFVVDRNPEQIKYVNGLMAGINIKYGILYNELDATPGRRWRMQFDASGWQQALIDTGVKP